MAQEALLSAGQAQPNRTRQPLRARRFLIGFLAFIVAVLLLLWYIGVFGGNVRVVVPGRVYRSAQLTGSTLGHVLDQDHIRTVINLRGGSSDNGYYRSELQECTVRNIQHVDIPFSARFLPPPQRLHKLLDTFDHATYPVLFHCQGGADRSGMAGTLYMHLYQHMPLDEAEHRQLTWRYGHIRFGVAHAMDDFFTLYRQTRGGMGIREWIDRKYPALYAKSPLAMKGDASDVSPTTPEQLLRPAPTGVERGRALSPGG